MSNNVYLMLAEFLIIFVLTYLVVKIFYTVFCGVSWVLNKTVKVFWKLPASNFVLP